MGYQKSLDMPESDKSLHIIAEQRGNKWYIFGETWLRRRTLAREGGKWEESERGWVFADPLPDTVKALVTVWRDDQETAETPVEPAAQPAPVKTPKAKPAALVTDGLPGWFVPPSWWQLIQLFIQHRPAIAVVGPAGNGKTTAVEMALEVGKIPFLSLSCTDRTEVVDLVGGVVLTAEGEAWRDGLVTTAFKQGKAVVLDEADALDPRVMMALQNALQDGGMDNKARFVNTPDGRVYPADRCPIILCMNTTGDGATRTYNGRNKLDAASLDRLSYISTGYENEAKMITARGYSKFTAGQVVAWAETMRKKIDETGLALPLSPRTLLRMAQGIETFSWTLETAATIEFLARLDPERRQLLA